MTNHRYYGPGPVDGIVWVDLPNNDAETVQPSPDDRIVKDDGQSWPVDEVLGVELRPNYLETPNKRLQDCDYRDLDEKWQWKVKIKEGIECSKLA